MQPPLLSYVAFNRLGLTARNLKALLDNTSDDFEMHIIDSNSKDDTWEFIQELNDCRIKSKTRLPINYGPIYAANLNLTKRKQGQYFIALDSDVYIYTNDWITKFMKVFDKFPEVGLLGLKRGSPYPDYTPEVILVEKDGISYLKLKNGCITLPMDFVPGHCQFLRPELIDIIGYWSEECHFGDAELSIRVNNYTPFKAGFVTDVVIDMIQSIPCDHCTAQHWCKLNRKSQTCFSIRNSKYKNESFVNTYGWKCPAFFDELDQGKRTVYCASIHDPESIKNHTYNIKWARENFNYYEVNAN